MIGLNLFPSLEYNQSPLTKIALQSDMVLVAPSRRIALDLSTRFLHSYQANTPKGSGLYNERKVVLDRIKIHMTLHLT